MADFSFLDVLHVIMTSSYRALFGNVTKIYGGFGFDPRQGRNFKFLPGIEFRWNGGAEHKYLVSVLNTPELNHKSLRSA